MNVCHKQLDGWTARLMVFAKLLALIALLSSIKRRASAVISRKKDVARQKSFDALCPPNSLLQNTLMPTSKRKSELDPGVLMMLSPVMPPLFVRLTGVRGRPSL